MDFQKKSAKIPFETIHLFRKRTEYLVFLSFHCIHSLRATFSYWFAKIKKKATSKLSVFTFRVQRMKASKRNTIIIGSNFEFQGFIKFKVNNILLMNMNRTYDVVCLCFFSAKYVKIILFPSHPRILFE